MPCAKSDQTQQQDQVRLLLRTSIGTRDQLPVAPEVLPMFTVFFSSVTSNSYFFLEPENGIVLHTLHPERTLSLGQQHLVSEENYFGALTRFHSWLPWGEWALLYFCQGTLWASWGLEADQGQCSLWVSMGLRGRKGRLALIHVHVHE